MIFFNLPEVHSYVASCMFVGNIMKILWRNKNQNQYYNKFSIRKIDSIWFSKPDISINRNEYGFNAIGNSPNRIIHHTVVEVISMFFPEKNEKDIIDELYNNKMLYSRLIGCFSNASNIIEYDSDIPLI